MDREHVSLENGGAYVLQRPRRERARERAPGPYAPALDAPSVPPDVRSDDNALYRNGSPTCAVSSSPSPSR
ncbi:MAG: hypothetical protein BGO98_24230 [Myxococcales bacterium 68-20]|nr:MAG: hypothetical protein BGO98_24230 [Myxococcales bacterium 68-20]